MLCVLIMLRILIQFQAQTLWSLPKPFFVCLLTSGFSLTDPIKSAYSIVTRIISIQFYFTYYLVLGYYWMLKRSIHISQSLQWDKVEYISSKQAEVSCLFWQFFLELVQLMVLLFFHFSLAVLSRESLLILPMHLPRRRAILGTKHIDPFLVWP